MLLCSSSINWWIQRLRSEDHHTLFVLSTPGHRREWDSTIFHVPSNRPPVHQLSSLGAEASRRCIQVLRLSVSEGSSVGSFRKSQRNRLADTQLWLGILILNYLLFHLLIHSVLMAGVT